MTLGFNPTIRNMMLDQITAFAGNGARLRFYNDPKPATGVAISTQLMLAELVCGSPLGAASTGGSLTFAAITPDSSADNTGTATWFRIVKSDGSTHVMDGTVNTTGADINLNTQNIVQSANVSMSSFTISAGNA